MPSPTIQGADEFGKRRVPPSSNTCKTAGESRRPVHQQFPSPIKQVCFSLGSKPSARRLEIRFRGRNDISRPSLDLSQQIVRFPSCFLSQ